MPVLKEIFLLEAPHILLTSVIALYFYFRFRSWRLVVLCFITGLFIDLDHLFDYFRYFGWRGLDPTGFFSGNIFKGSGKVFVLLHSWELLIPLWVFGSWAKKKKEAFALTAGFVGHLLTDYFSYHMPWPFYFFVYRLLTSFAPPCR